MEWTSDDGRIRLICGDCLKILPSLAAGSVGAVIVDPPYFGLKGKTEFRAGGIANRKQSSQTVGDPWNASLSYIAEIPRLSNTAAIFCCHRDLLIVGNEVERCGGTVVGYYVWHKHNAPLPVNNVPHYTSEFAILAKWGPGADWQAMGSTTVTVPMMSAGCIATPERILECKGGKAVHPCQKPIAVMKPLTLITDGVVLDCYAGTGSTAIACIQTGRRFIGIEIEPRYFEIAKNRIITALGGTVEGMPQNATLFAGATA